VDLFLEVAGNVLQRYKSGPVHFLWVGGLPHVVRQMQARIQSSSLRDVVHFIGPKADVTPYYAASDIFVLASREDPFPLVMMEAALREKPIVCFDQSGGAPEFVESDAGFIVPGFHVDEMAKRVVDLLSSPDLCKRLGMNAREKVLRRHDINIGATQIATIIEKALRDNPRALDFNHALQQF
jgi:glycosyltransferase involved in cell wall biosynthesis